MKFELPKEIKDKLDREFDKITPTSENCPLCVTVKLNASKNVVRKEPLGKWGAIVYGMIVGVCMILLVTWDGADQRWSKQRMILAIFCVPPLMALGQSAFNYLNNHFASEFKVRRFILAIVDGKLHVHAFPVINTTCSILDKADAVDKAIEAGLDECEFRSTATELRLGYDYTVPKRPNGRREDGYVPYATHLKNYRMWNIEWNGTDKSYAMLQSTNRAAFGPPISTIYLPWNMVPLFLKDPKTFELTESGYLQPRKELAS